MSNYTILSQRVEAQVAFDNEIECRPDTIAPYECRHMTMAPLWSVRLCCRTRYKHSGMRNPHTGR